jgi:hypothetical protein
LAGSGVEGDETCSLVDSKGASCGRVVVHVTTVSVVIDAFAIVEAVRGFALCLRPCQGQGLPSKELFGKQDPFVSWTVISSSGVAVSVGRSSVVRRGGTDPRWPTTECSRLCFESGAAAIRVRVDVFDEDKGSFRDDSIGFGTPTLRLPTSVPTPALLVRLPLLEAVSKGVVAPIVGAVLEFEAWFDVVGACLTPTLPPRTSFFVLLPLNGLCVLVRLEVMSLAPVGFVVWTGHCCRRSRHRSCPDRSWWLISARADPHLCWKAFHRTPTGSGACIWSTAGHCSEGRAPQVRLIRCAGVSCRSYLMPSLIQLSCISGLS